MLICGSSPPYATPPVTTVILKGHDDWAGWYLGLKAMASDLGLWEHIDPDAPEPPALVEPVLPTRELAVQSILTKRAASSTASSTTSHDTPEERVEMVAEPPPSESAITMELFGLGEDCLFMWKSYLLKDMAARIAHKQLGDWLNQSVDAALLATARLKTLGSNQHNHRAVVQYLKDHLALSKASIPSRVEIETVAPAPDRLALSKASIPSRIEIATVAPAPAERPDKTCHTTCELCQRAFGSWSAWEQHALAKHPDACCEECRRAFRTQSDRELHDRIWHPDTYCERCQRYFSSPSAKQRHLADSSSHNVCEICSDESDRPDFLFKWDLDEHIEHDHNYCEVCKLDFLSPCKLTRHDVDVHNMCEICREYFTAPSNLNSVSSHPESKAPVG